MPSSKSSKKRRHVGHNSHSNIATVTAEEHGHADRKRSNANDLISLNGQANNNVVQKEQILLENMAQSIPNDILLTSDCNDKPAPILIDAEQSSFEETLGVVSNKDDPDILCLTFRSWILGLIFVITYSVVNQYFLYQNNGPYLISLFIVLLAFPLGRLLAWILPKRTWFEGHRFAFSLNPGPFTIKEHTIIYNMAFVAVQSVLPCDLFVQISLLKEANTPPVPHYLVGLLFVLCSQLIGYGFAGVLRRLLVWPSEMVWRWNFPYMVVLRTMNEPESRLSARWLNLTRRRFFVIVLVASFVYHWLPSIIFPMLFLFPWWCLINERSTVLSQITGPNGFAMGLIPLSWSVLQGTYNLPLIPPWWAYANIIFGFVVIGWFIIPIMYYFNVSGWARLPVTGTESYEVIDHPNQKQSTITAALVTYLYLGAMLGLILHTILFHGLDLLSYARTSLRNRQNDVHCTLIGKYKDVSGWIYGILFLLTFVGLCLICHFARLMPWYYMFVAVGVGAIIAITMGVVQAQAAIVSRPYIVVYFLCGIIFHNRPVDSLTFFFVTHATSVQALIILQNFKLAHYMKIAPRSMFIVQVVSTVLASTLAYIITRYVMSTVPNYCGTNSAWQCQSLDFNPYNYAKIDMNQMYGLESVYPWLLWVMIAVSVLPFFVWVAHRIWPRIKWIRFIHIPIMIFYLANIRFPFSGYVGLPTWLLLGVICHKVIRRWWFDRYVFLFTITMTMGAGMTDFFAFFTLTYNNVTFPLWWGTQTNVCPLASAAANGSFVLQ